MTISQYLFNNLWYGENSREKNRHKLFFDSGFAYVISTIQPDGTRIFGIDISHWNKPPVNLKEMVRLYNLQFVIIKGCDGSVNTNYYFEHVAAAKEAGIPWGMYVWLYPAGKVNIDAQVNAWHARAIIDPPPMGIFIDAEWTYYGGVAANPNANDLRAAHDKIKVKQDKAATTYTAKGYADTYLKGFDWTREELWVAHYGVFFPSLPTGATGHIIHQFTSEFLFNGVNYDGNYFNGSQAEFTARYGTPTPPPIGETMYTGTAKLTATPNVRLRQANADGSPNPSGTTIGAIQPGQAFKGDLISGSWMRVTEIGTKTVLALTGKPYGFSALQYLNYELVTVPPPPPARVVTDVNIALAAGSVVTRKYSDGSTETETA